MEKVFFCLAFFLLSQSPVFAQNPSGRLVNASYVDQPLRDVLADLQEKYGIDIFYKQAWIKDIVITADFTNEPLLDLLEDILGPHEISFLIYETNIVLIKGASNINSVAFRASKLDESRDSKEYLKIGSFMENPDQQKVTINGFVREGGNDETLIGASVYINELKLGQQAKHRV